MAFDRHGVRAIIMSIGDILMISFAVFLLFLWRPQNSFAYRLARLSGIKASTWWSFVLRIATFIPTAGSVAWTRSIFSILISWMTLTCALFHNLVRLHFLICFICIQNSSFYSSFFSIFHLFFIYHFCMKMA